MVLYTAEGRREMKMKPSHFCAQPTSMTTLEDLLDFL